MRRLRLTQIEMVALKAILTIDPNAAKLDNSSLTILAIARESVQTALYANIGSRFSSSEATARFGNILLLISNISVSFIIFISIISFYHFYHSK